MEREEKIRLAREQREAEYSCAVEEFREYLPQKQKRIVEYMKKISEITDWTFLWLWDDTPYQEWSLRKKVLAKMHEGGDENAIFASEGV